MKATFPGAIPELPVSDIKTALDYYANRLGFTVDWGDQGGDGIAGISKGDCRMFVTDAAFRERLGNSSPVLVWLNLQSKEEVNALHDLWRANDSKIISPPESKPWGLHEFTVSDLDGNLLRVFYDFATPEHS